MIVRRAIFADVPALRVAFAHLVADLEVKRVVPYPMHDAETLDQFTLLTAHRVEHDPRLLLYVALEDDTHALLGFLGGEVAERALGNPTRFGAAHWLYVDPTARGRGVARALVRCACADLAALGITHVELNSLTGDTQWLERGWLPYLVHYVLPVSAVAVAAAERRPAVEAAPALEVPAELPAVATNGNGHTAPTPRAPRARKRRKTRRRRRTPATGAPCA